MAKFMVPMFVIVEAETSDMVYDKIVQIQEAARGFDLRQDELLTPKKVADTEELEDDAVTSILDVYSTQELADPYKELVQDLP